MFSSITARTRVLYTGGVNQTITLPRGPSKYPIKDISGLGPAGAHISRVQDVSDRGTEYLSSLTDERNIVMRLGFSPNYAANETITALRLALNKVFMPGNSIELDFEHEVYGTVRIKGNVESNEPVIFAKDPEVQISIICPDPYFVSTGPMESYTLPGGTGTQFIVNSDLDVPVGFIWDFGMTGNRASGVMLFGESPRVGDRTLFLSRDLQIGDQVLINTIKGERRVQMTRSASTTSELGHFHGSLVDSRMYPGPNHYRLNEISSMENIRFRWYKTYGSL